MKSTCFPRWKQHHWKHLLQPQNPSKVTPPKRNSQHLPILSKVHGQQVHANKGIELNVRCLPRVIFSNGKKNPWKSEWRYAAGVASKNTLRSQTNFLLQGFKSTKVHILQSISINFGIHFGTRLPIAPRFGFRQYESIHVFLLVSHGWAQCQKNI